MIKAIMLEEEVGPPRLVVVLLYTTVTMQVAQKLMTLI